MFQKRVAAIVLGLFLLLAIIPISVSAYPSAIDVVSNEAGFSTSVAKCEDSNCKSLTSLDRSDITSGTNKNTYTVTGSGAQTFVEYDYMACRDPHIFINDFDDATGPGPHRFDVTFSQKQGCTAPITELKAEGNLVEGQNGKVIQFTTASPFNYPAGAEGTPIPANLQEHFGAKTKLTFELADPLSIKTNTESESEISMSSELPGSLTMFAFTNGTYIIKAKTEVTDCACSSQIPQEKTITVQVADTSPTANAGASKTGIQGQPLTFDGSATVAAFDPIKSYLWDFGDGQTETGKVVQHTYAQNGTFTATLTVTDSDGSTSQSATTVTIADTIPTANFSADKTSGDEPLSVQFTDTSQSTDSISSYLWDFGDSSTSAEKNPSHIFIVTEQTPQKTFSVKLTVTDSDGSSSTATKTISVNKIPLTAFFISPQTVTEGSTVTFDGSGSSGPIKDYIWDFGDGTNVSATAKTVDHTFAQNGTYTVSLTVVDFSGNSDKKSLSVIVIDTVPEANIGTGPIQEGPNSFVARILFSYDAITDFSWAIQELGSPVILTSKNQSFTPVLNNGTYNITLIVTDSDGSADEVIGQITVHDNFPTAAFSTDQISTPTEGTTVNFIDTSFTQFDPIVLRKWLIISMAELLNLPKINVTLFTSFESAPAGNLYFNIVNAVAQQPAAIKFVGSTLVNFDYKNLPIDNLFPNSRAAAEAAECARDQGKQALLDYAHTLYSNQGFVNFTSSNLKAFAADIGLNQTQFNSCVDNRDKKSKVEADEAEANSLGILGVPTTFVNNIQISGSQSVSVFRNSLVSEALRLWPFVSVASATLQRKLAGNGTLFMLFHVADSDGSGSETAASGDVLDASPSVTLTAPTEAFTNQLVQLSALVASVSDNITAIDWDFNFTGIFNPQASSGKSISHTFTQPGLFTVAVRVSDTDSETVKVAQISVQNLVHDIFVSPLSISKSTTIYLFDNIAVSSSVANIGTVPETFTIRLKDGSKILSTQNETLQPNQSKQLSFTWAPDSEGLHDISVEAIPVSGEANTADNQKTMFSLNVLSVKNSISLEFVNPFNFPSNSEPANSTFFVWVRASENSIEKLQDISLRLNVSGLTINQTQDSDFNPTKTYPELSGVRTYWWKLNSGSAGLKTVSVEIGNQGDSLLVSRQISIV